MNRQALVYLRRGNVLYPYECHTLHHESWHRISAMLSRDSSQTAQVGRPISDRESVESTSLSEPSSYSNIRDILFIARRQLWHADLPSLLALS